MKSWLAALLVSASLVVVAPPADASRAASPVVTLRASATQLRLGDAVVLTGRAKYSRPGSRVILQRRAATGWVTIGEKRTRDDRSFRFQRRPALGEHRLRVVKPRQFGQTRAVSPVVVLRVTELPPPPPPPAPALNVSSHPGFTDDGVHVLVLSGTVSGLVAPTITVERRYGSDGAWSSLDSPTAAPGDDGVFELAVHDRLDAEFRVVATPGDGGWVLRSQVFANAHMPYALDLNSSVTFYDVYDEEHAATVVVDLAQGDEVTFAARGLGDGHADVLDPNGQPVGSMVEASVVRFVADLAGDYTIDVSHPDVPTISASTTKTVHASVDGEQTVFYNTLDGQVLDVVVPLEEGEAVVLNDQQGQYASRAVFGPDGNVVPRRAHANVHNSPDTLYSVYQAESSGDHTFHYIPGAGGALFVVETFASVPVYTAVADGTRFEVQPAPGHPITLVDLALAEGQRVTTTVQNGDDRTWFVTPADELLYDHEPIGFRAALAGHYSLLVATPSEDGVPVEVASDVELSTTLGASTEYDNTNGLLRTVWLTVPIAAGQAVYATTSPEAAHSSMRSLPRLVSGPDDVSVRPDFPASNLGWVIETTGDHRFEFGVAPGWKGSVTFHTANEIVVATDGTPTRLETTEAGQLVFARLTGTPGQSYTITASDPDPAYVWAVTVGQGLGGSYGAWLDSYDPTGTFVMPPNGVTYLGFGSDNAVAGVTVTIAAQAG